MVKAKSRVVKEFKGGEGIIESGEAKIEGGEANIESSDGIRGW